MFVEKKNSECNTFNHIIFNMVKTIIIVENYFTQDHIFLNCVNTKCLN